MNYSKVKKTLQRRLEHIKKRVNDISVASNSYVLGEIGALQHALDAVEYLNPHTNPFEYELFARHRDEQRVLRRQEAIDIARGLKPQAPLPEDDSIGNKVVAEEELPDNVGNA